MVVGIASILSLLFPIRKGLLRDARQGGGFLLRGALGPQRQRLRLRLGAGLVAAGPQLGQLLGAEEHNAALKVKVRVEHRLGEVLAATVGRGRPEKNGQTDRFIPEVLGETKDQRQNTSKRTQALAALPWGEIEAAIDARTAATSSGVPWA
jgi:hypothetical protein